MAQFHYDLATGKVSETEPLGPAVTFDITVEAVTGDAETDRKVELIIIMPPATQLALALSGSLPPERLI